jgi:hypothetical protein
MLFDKGGKMKKLPMLSIKWLALGLMMLALLTLAFTGGEGETNPAHCYPCSTPTFTPTPTLTPPPPIQACQIVGVDFDQASYQVGSPINVTVRLANAQGAPLVGAKVDAEVIRQPLSIQAVSASILLEDQSGTYDGLYNQTQNPGDYLFKFRASDPTGTRFLPCTAERTIRVEPNQCTITVTAEPNPAQLGQPIALSANVTVNGLVQNGAVVSATVRKPDNKPEPPLSFSGPNPFTGRYTNTNVLGNYTFDVTASDPNQSFKTCSTSITVPVERELIPCQATPLEFDQPQYIVNQAIRFTSTVTNTSGITPVVTAIVKRPSGQEASVPLFNSGIVYTGIYTNTSITGTYEFKLTAHDPNNPANFGTCMAPPGTRSVNLAPPTPTVKVVPPLITTTLCSLRETHAVIVENATDIVEVNLILSYNPSLIQVIDADNRTLFGVQVRVNDIFATGAVLTNTVDTRLGRIYFAAKLLNGSRLNGSNGLIAIDWRPQAVGNSPVKLEQALFTDSAGRTVSATLQDGAVQINFVADCRTGSVALQGRTDYSGVVVTNASGQQVQTDFDGYFAIVAQDHLSFTFPGYLAGQAKLPASPAANQAEAEVTKLETLTLLAGDANSDNNIDILDLAHLAQYYLSAEPSADLNGDGTVNILDLALVAGNFQQHGPITVKP